MSVFKGIKFLSHVVAQAEKKVLINFLTQALSIFWQCQRKYNFLMKSGNKYEFTCTKIKFLNPSVSSIVQVCVLNISVSQLPNITTTLIGYLYLLPILHDPSHTGALTQFAKFLNFFYPPI